MTIPAKYFDSLVQLLEKKNISVSYNGELFICSCGENTISIFLPTDLIVTAPRKVAATIQSRLSLNETVFARNCKVEKIDKTTAENFLDTYHLMNSTSSAFNYGLFLKDELLAVASFSKGRKMNRLVEDKRSFELIRFATREGITVTGGLTKLLKHFCREKKAGDIMTYIDKQFSGGNSFFTSGFKKHGETAPNYFLLDKTTFERIPAIKDAKFDPNLFELVQNDGNLKLVFACDE